MKQLEVFNYPFPSADQPHPAVIISNPGICQNPNIEFVNVLFGQSVRPITRPKKENEVYLDTSDGLDGKTLFKCDMIFQVPKKLLLHKRGEVSPQRIEEIRRKFRQYF